ncbi:hypothetical protein LVY74_11660 [Acinetobacter sp. ME22]|uniref:hypothetical protein n=1 Tax=Acinetobacter sp. ME22 TaxID=2904802 RepID=UPI001EDA9F9A|nr:hypothetical protein [Acinetobacter sp. ME22]MCG2574206.1 hypothetical protein [Acinetobacter sp. ME22]
MLNIFEIRRSNVLRITKLITRKKLASLIGMEYGLLNQYLREKNPKNFGTDTTNRITSALNLADGWLDHLHDDEIITFLFDKDKQATNYDAKATESETNQPSPSSNQLNDAFRITKVILGLLVMEGSLELTSDLEELYSVHYPDNLKTPISFLIVGNTQNKPYKNGWVLICEKNGLPVEGEDCLFFTKDNKVFAGEVLFKKDGFIEIEDIFKQRMSLKISNLKDISPVKLYIPPSQKIKSSY